MNTVQTSVHAGICGHVTDITAVADEEQLVRCTVTSPCMNIQELITWLPKEIDAYQEIGDGYSGVIWQAAHATLRGGCSSCVVPSGIFKAMLVAAGLVLPADFTIHFQQQQ